jgi:hypothetical protein
MCYEEVELILQFLKAYAIGGWDAENLHPAWSGSTPLSFGKGLWLVSRMLLLIVIVKYR